jgi:hypothetical protein
LPPQGTWEEEHGRFDRRRLARVAVTPEENGIYELQKERKATTADSLKSWCQQQTFTAIWPILQH